MPQVEQRDAFALWAPFRRIFELLRDVTPAAHSWNRRRKRPIAGLLLLALVAPLPHSEANVANDRVVAIGDIHGAYDGLVSILRKAELIDGENRWIGGATTLVQTGDFLDRGLQLREVMDLLMSLQEQADAQGGRAIVLLGNHEIFNLTGDFADVAPEAFAGFADERSPKRQQKAYKNYLRWATRQADLLAAAGLMVESEMEWFSSHPPGWVEYQEAFGPQGHYGRWLRTLPSVARLGDTLFMHGGLAPEFAESNTDSINRQISEELARLDRCRTMLVTEGLIIPTSSTVEMVKLSVAQLIRLQDDLAKMKQPGSHRDLNLERNRRRQHGRIYDCVSDYDNWLLKDNRGPQFFRGHAKSSSGEGRSDLTRVFNGWSAERLVVGHTPTANGRIRQRFDGRVFFIDTGMLSTVYEGGRASALEIRGGRLRALYVDGSEELWPKPATNGSEGDNDPSGAAHPH